MPSKRRSKRESRPNKLFKLPKMQVKRRRKSLSYRQSLMLRQLRQRSQDKLLKRSKKRRRRQRQKDRGLRRSNRQPKRLRESGLRPRKLRE